MRRSVSTTALVILAACLVPVLAGSAAPAAGQTLADYDYVHLTFRGVGVGGGYLWSNRIEDTEQYSVRVDLGYLGPGVRIIPSVTYWSSELAQGEIDAFAAQLSQRTGTTILGSELGPVDWSDLSLEVDGHFVWSTPFDVLTFVGAGLGLHALNGGGPAVDGTFVEALLDDVTAGVNGIVGLEAEPVERLRVYLEGRYTAMASLSYGAVRGGVQLMFSTGDVEVGAVDPAPDPGPGRAP